MGDGVTEHKVDLERMKTDSRYAAWVRSTHGARRTSSGVLDDDEIEALRAAQAARPKAVQAPYNSMVQGRTGKRTAQAIAALVNLRADILAGLPPKALLERIDDELFRLKK